MNYFLQTLQQIRAKAFGYWENLNKREQVLLAGGGIILCLYVFFTFLYLPLEKKLYNQLLVLHEKQETLQWINSLPQPSKHSIKMQTMDTNQLLSLISEELSASAFIPFKYQMHAIDTSNIQLSFTEIPYNIFIHWLWQLNEHVKIMIKKLTIERSHHPGLVQVNLTLGTS